VLGRQKPGWGKEDFKPVWWPEQIKFTDVNNNPPPRHKRLMVIMEHYRDWRKRQSWGPVVIMTIW